MAPSPTLASLHAEWGPLLGMVATALGLALGIGGVLAYLKVGMQKTTTELWKENSSALQARVEQLETEKDHQEERINELEKHNLALQREVETLRELATGQHAVDALGEIILRQHGEVTELLRKIQESQGPDHAT